MISDNIKRVKENIDNALVRSNRSDSCKLIAVTKFVDMERIRQAIEAGIQSVGENRVQELLYKLDFFKSYNLDINLIGQLQTNKVKYVMGQVGIIQSLDRMALAKEINKQALAKEIMQNVLIEVNIGSEEQKGGITPQELQNFLEEVSEFKGIRVKGLMCIPPFVSAEEVKPYFEKMANLFTKIKQQNIQNIAMDELSMGMSNDYEVAVEFGATMVRVGTSIFGSRI